MAPEQTDIITIQTEKQLIRDIAGLSGTAEIKLNDRGWESRVYSFNEGRYFFKFPRSKYVQKLYEYEIAAIKYVENLDTKVISQKILWEHPDNSYFGYEGVQGSSVAEMIHELDGPQKKVMGGFLGEFLKKFHMLQLPGARTMSLEDESKQIQQWYEGCKFTAKKYLTASEQQKLKQLVYEVWPTKLIQLGSERVLSHGDLSFENIIYGYNGSVGIIDFGDVAYYDRSKDFLELEDDETIFKAALAVYGDNDTKFLEKIAVRQAMIQIINLGVHAGRADEASTMLTLDKIKAKL